MTIGPDPITRTDLRSSRRGMPTLHEGAELIEVVNRVVRARGGLGVVLDAEGGVVQQPDPFHDAVVEVDVADDGRPVWRAERLARGVRHVRPTRVACAGLAKAPPLPGAGHPRWRRG